jgi:hypothetical protein
MRACVSPSLSLVHVSSDRKQSNHPCLCLNREGIPDKRIRGRTKREPELPIVFVAVANSHGSSGRTGRRDAHVCAHISCAWMNACMHASVHMNLCWMHDVCGCACMHAHAWHTCGLCMYDVVKCMDIWFLHAM